MTLSFRGLGASAVASRGAARQFQAPLPERTVEPASPLVAWETFYLIVGSAAGALTGLQFVVVALSADSRAMQKSELSLLAFGTPTIVHFSAVLLIAAILSAPWSSLATAGLVLTVCGATGIAYTAIVIRRAGQQRGYTPVFEDWLWHAVLPAIGYLGQMVAASTLADHPSEALFGLATVAMLLIFVGIHNAWDAAAYIAVSGHAPAEQHDPSPPAAAPSASSGESQQS